MTDAANQLAASIAAEGNVNRARFPTNGSTEWLCTVQRSFCQALTSEALRFLRTLGAEGDPPRRLLGEGCPFSAGFLSGSGICAVLR